MAGEGAPEVGPKESADKTKVQKKHRYLGAGCLQKLIKIYLSPGHVPLRVPEVRVFLLGVSGVLPLTTGSLVGGWSLFWTTGPGLGTEDKLLAFPISCFPICETELLAFL